MLLVPACHAPSSGTRQHGDHAGLGMSLLVPAPL
jgi:hypothetical protein